MDTRGSHVVRGRFRTEGPAVFEEGAETPYAEFGDWKSSGTAGGTNQAYVWEKRTITQVTHDYDDFVLALTDNEVITLEAGEYYIDASVPAFSVGEHQARLYDATLGETIIEGTSEIAADTADGSQTRSLIKGQFTLDTNTDVQIEHACAVVQPANGWGYDAGFYIDNLYTHVSLWQIRSGAV